MTFCSLMPEFRAADPLETARSTAYGLVLTGERARCGGLSGLCHADDDLHARLQLGAAHFGLLSVADAGLHRQGREFAVRIQVPQHAEISAAYGSSAAAIVVATAARARTKAAAAREAGSARAITRTRSRAVAGAGCRLA